MLKHEVKSLNVLFKWNLSWDEVSEKIHKQLNHLKTLDNDVIKSFCVAQDGHFKTYATLYDLSAGDEDKVS